jgi:hypothetical protein
LPAYDARCLQIGLKVLSDRRIVTNALFARDILVGREDCPDLDLMLQFEEVPYSRRRSAELMTFFNRTNYGRFEPVNNAIINLISIVIGLVFVARWVAICFEIG